jgi:plasmid stabilization system protein ParE
VAKKAKVSEECENMVREAAVYIAKNSLKQAEILFDEFDQHIDLIEAMPGIGMKYKNGMRRFLLGKFPYYIYYREKENIIEILGIWHTSRGTEFEET